VNPPIYDPDAHDERSTVERRSTRGTEYNTHEVIPGGRVQSCCKCFGARVTKGACSGHFAQLSGRLYHARLALQAVCGWAFDQGRGES
jgi:hypothetical protein